MPVTQRSGKIGLALGSGSARGWAHIGVIKALEERGIRPDVVSGASTGSLVAAACASGQIENLESWVRSLTKIDVWRLMDANFGGGGVMTGNKLMRAVSEQLEDHDIEDLDCQFGAVAADLYSGREVWLRNGPMLSAVRASSGLPGLFTPVQYEGRWLIDGGVVNPVPVSLCRALGADYVIAVSLSRRFADEVLRRPDEDSTDSVQASMMEVMYTSINIMADQITRSRLAGDPPDVVIRPRLSDFRLMEFHRAAEAIDEGYAAVERLHGELAMSPGVG